VTRDPQELNEIIRLVKSESNMFYTESKRGRKGIEGVGFES